MDQLKQAFSVIKKYHFWILCGLIVLLYIGMWYTSTSSMSKVTESRVSAINSSFSTGDQIAQIQNHANDGSAQMMKELNRAEAEQVRLAWERRYREQEDVLVWPEELLPDFILAVEQLKPIEAKLDFPTPPEQELLPGLRNRYRDYIRKELPKLADIIGAEWKVGAGGGAASGMGGGSMMPGGGSMMPGGSGMGGGSMLPGAPGAGSMMPGGGSMSPGGGSMMPGAPGMGGMGSGGGSMMPGMGSGGTGYPGAGSGGSSGMGSGGSTGGMGELLTADGKPIVVDWSASNQAALQAACMNWTSPTTLQILYAQEDLWVLRSLMLIIKATNGDADAQYNAAVKEILSIELGAMAAGIKSTGSVSGTGGMAGFSSTGSMMPGSSLMPGSGSGGGGGSGGGSGGGESGSNPYSGMMGSGSGSGDVGSSVDPARGRYVDDKNEPLAGDRLRSAIKSNTSGDAFLAVAKRMPMRMRVRMNVLKLPLFLCEFSQAKLPVEVRQVRINTPAGSGGLAGPSGSGGGGFGSGGPPQLRQGSAGSGGGAGASMNMSPESGGGGGSGGMGSGGLLGAMGGTGMPGGSGGGGGDSGVASLNAESPYDATVDIYGIIYIYNPVDPAKLGIDTKKALDGTTSAAAASPDGTAASGTETAPAGPATAPADAAAADDATADSATTAEPPAGGATAAPADGTTPASDGTAAPADAADAGSGATAPVAPATPAADGTTPAPPAGDGSTPAPPPADPAAPSGG